MRTGLYGRIGQISYTPPPAVVAPGQVTGLAAGTADTSSVPLNWQADTLGTPPISYRIEFKRSADATWSLDTTQAGTSRTVSGLQAGTAYQFRVRAENTAGAGAYSAVASASTTAAVITPGPPQNLRTLSGGTSSQINAAWDQGTGGVPDQYEVWHRPGTTGSYSLRGTTTGLSFLFSINPAVTTHFVYVVARNSAGTAQSATMQVTVA